MDRKFGEHQLAYMLCRQELRPNVYSSTNIIYAGAKRQCSMNVEAADHANWSIPLREEGTAALVGFLNDGTVAGQIKVKGSSAGGLVVWKKDQTTVTLPGFRMTRAGQSSAQRLICPAMPHSLLAKAPPARTLGRTVAKPADGWCSTETRKSRL